MSLSSEGMRGGGGAPSERARRTEQVAIETFSTPIGEATRARPLLSVSSVAESSCIMRCSRLVVTNEGWDRRKAASRRDLRCTGASWNAGANWASVCDLADTERKMSCNCTVLGRGGRPKI